MTNCVFWWKILQFFEKIPKDVVGRFWLFSTIFDIFDFCILKFVFKGLIWLQREILEARFLAPSSKSYFSFFRTSGRNFKRSTRSSNVRPEIRTFRRKFRLPPNFSNVQFFWILMSHCEPGWGLKADAKSNNILSCFLNGMERDLGTVEGFGLGGLWHAG